MSSRYEEISEVSEVDVGEADKLVGSDGEEEDDVDIEEEEVRIDEKGNVVKIRKHVVHDPIPIWVKLAYGAGEIGIYVPSSLEGFFLTTYLLVVVGMDPSQAAVLLLISQLYDAFVGPIIGHFSDQTRSRWGRRKPWIAISAIPMAISWIALWQNPYQVQLEIEEDEEGVMIYSNEAEYGQTPLWLMFYYLACLLSFNTFHAMMAVSYTSLTPEITSDYNERTSLTVFRFGMSMCANLVFTFIHSTLIEAFPDKNDPNLSNPQKGYTISSILVAGAMLVSAGVLLVGVPSGKLPKKKKGAEGMSGKEKFEVFLKTFRAMFKIGPFVSLAGVYLLGWSAVCFIQANLVLYISYQLNLGQYLSLILLSVQSFSVIGFPVWGRLSKTLEKRTCYFIGVFLFIPCIGSLYFLPDDTHVWTMCTIGACAGFMLSMLFVIPWSMVPDTIDYTEIVLNDRRDGIFYSTFIVFTKIGVAASLFMSSFILGLVGFESPLHASPSELELGEPQPHKVSVMIDQLFSSSCDVRLN